MISPACCAIGASFSPAPPIPHRRSYCPQVGLALPMCDAYAAVMESGRLSSLLLNISISPQRPLQRSEGSAANRASLSLPPYSESAPRPARPRTAAVPPQLRIAAPRFDSHFLACICRTGCMQCSAASLHLQPACWLLCWDLDLSPHRLIIGGVSCCFLVGFGISARPIRLTFTAVQWRNEGWSRLVQRLVLSELTLLGQRHRGPLRW
mmetsp:Transcript_37079/g.77525  ORF Transcript_37079/g.77525 Transcript_37079/m.77525 type:complete len:208 (-) Transcript_37079:790-1413(-)